jgi:Asp/Glu/hydantoin racemase
MNRNPRRHHLPSADLKRALLDAALTEFGKCGWTISPYRENGCGTSVRVIEKTIKEEQKTRIFEANGEPAGILRETRDTVVRYVIALKTSQTGALGFVRDATDNHWAGLSGVDAIIVSCVDHPRHPSNAVLHVLDARTACARVTKEHNKQSRKSKPGRKKAPTFLPIRDLKSQRDLKFVGPITGILANQEQHVSLESFLPLSPDVPGRAIKKQPIRRYTIRVVRRLLARSLGVDIADVRISILPGQSRGRVRRTSEQLSKRQTGDALFKANMSALQMNGWALSKTDAVRGRNARLASHENGAREHIRILTSQTGLIGFTRDSLDQNWGELQGIDRVIIACLDDRKKPLYAVVHAIRSDFLNEVFDAARQTKIRANSWNPAAPLWLAIHAMPPSNTDRASVCMDLGMHALLPAGYLESQPAGSSDVFLTIPEAKRLVAISYHVDESDVHIALETGVLRTTRRGYQALARRRFMINRQFSE